MLPPQVPPVHLAAASNISELVNMLKAAGADPMLAMDALGRSALHFASAKVGRIWTLRAIVQINKISIQ